MENENKLELKLTMRLRTYSSHAVVMYARGTDYSILEVCVHTSFLLGLCETMNVNSILRSDCSIENRERKMGLFHVSGIRGLNNF